MADNYIERRMEDLRNGKYAASIAKYKKMNHDRLRQQKKEAEDAKKAHESGNGSNQPN